MHSNNNYFYEEIIHESADKITTIKKVKNKEDDDFIVLKTINGMDRFTRLFFEREVNALKALNNSANIVKMYDHETHYDRHKDINIGSIFLEYIHGDSLQDTQVSIIEFKDNYSIILDIINAIETSHSKGIIHRDIKPANIMIIDYQSAKLIDFGISKIKGMITSGTVGTVANLATNKYTAPEVSYHSENSSYKSDIYSLGATLYYLLTGNEPPLPEFFLETLVKSSGINPKLKEIIAKSIQFNSDERYENVTDLKRDFLLITKELLKNSNYVISVPDEIFLTAKRKKFIPKHMHKSQFLETRLDDWFKTPYAFVDSSLKGSMELNIDHDVFLFGGKYKLVCNYNDYDEYFIARELVPVDSKVRNELTKSYMKVDGVLNFYTSTNFNIDKIKHRTHELVADLIDHRIEYESDKSKQNKFDKFFGAWTEYLETDKRSIKNTANKVLYKSCKYNKNGLIELVLDDNTDIDKLDFTSETILAYDSEINNIKNSNSYITVGYFKDIISDNNKIIIILEKIQNKSKRIPSAGILVVDYKTLIYVIEKQLKAIWLLRKNECECNENLRDLILGFEKPSSIKGFENMEYFNKELDLNQKEAVKKAKEAGIKIYTIGIGKKSDDDVSLLETIAKQSGAKSYAASSAKALSQIYEEINTLEPSAIRSENYLNQRLLILYPLGLVFILLLLWVLGTKRSER